MKAVILPETQHPLPKSQVVHRIQFLAVVGLRSIISSWLSEAILSSWSPLAVSCSVVLYPTWQFASARLTGESLMDGLSP